MRLRNVKNKEIVLKSSKLLVDNPSQYFGKWIKVFGNNNEIHLEIGMGKGDFLLGMSKLYPDINFIGIEKYDSVIVKAIEKIEEGELPKNIRLIRMDAKEIDKVFSNEINRIYLNFSDPWPKKRHSERRLTSKSFLTLYDGVFKEDKNITLKTDNRGLFEYSLESMSSYGYIFEQVSLDLHNSEIEVNVVTEYEKKFKEGKINYLKAIKKC